MVNAFNIYFKKYLIGEPSTLIDNDNGILLSLACKRMRGVLLGIQHSAGHFGYIDDLSYEKLPPGLGATSEGEPGGEDSY